MSIGSGGFGKPVRTSLPYRTVSLQNVSSDGVLFNSIFSESEVPIEETAYWAGELDTMLVDQHGVLPNDSDMFKGTEQLSPDTVEELWEKEQDDLHFEMERDAEARLQRVALLEADGYSLLEKYERWDKKSWRKASRIWRSSSQTPSRTSESSDDDPVLGELSVETMELLEDQEWQDMDAALHLERLDTRNMYACHNAMVAACEQPLSECATETPLTEFDKRDVTRSSANLKIQ